MRKRNVRKRLDLIKMLKKAWLFFVVGMVIVGFLVYEGYSITKKEYERQMGVANSAHEEVSLDLNMLKIAVQVGDAESYSSRMSGIKDEKMRIESLFMIQNEQSGYIGLLDEYLAVLDGKDVMVSEMKNLKEELTEIARIMRENYGNKDEITRDKIAGAKNEILKLKIDVSKYETEEVVTIANVVNEVVDGIADKAGILADCVDTCYKNRINEVNDELADIIKAFSDQVAGLNSGFEAEFEFEKMDEILEM